MHGGRSQNSSSNHQTILFDKGGEGQSKRGVSTQGKAGETFARQYSRFYVNRCRGWSWGRGHRDAGRRRRVLGTSEPTSCSKLLLLRQDLLVLLGQEVLLRKELLLLLVGHELLADTIGGCVGREPTRTLDRRRRRRLRLLHRVHRHNRDRRGRVGPATQTAAKATQEDGEANASPNHPSDPAEVRNTPPVFTTGNDGRTGTGDGNRGSAQKNSDKKLMQVDRH